MNVENRMIWTLISLCALCALVPCGLVDGAVVTAVYHTAAVAPPGVMGTAQQLSNWFDATLHSAQPTLADGVNAIQSLNLGEHLVLRPQIALTGNYVVLSAKLYQYVWAASAIGANLAWTGNVVNAAWTEPAVTWSNRALATPWAAAGGDYLATPSTNGSVTCSGEGYIEFDITPLMNVYLQDTNTYQGIVLRAPLASQPLLFGKDNGTSDTLQQPYLVLIYDKHLPPFIDITNGTAASVNYDVTSYTIGGTSIFCVGNISYESRNGIGGTVIDAGSCAAAAEWSVTINNLVVGTNMVTITGTNAFGELSDPYIIITRSAQASDPSDVADFKITHASGDYGNMTLSWSNGAITVLACTNQYYTADLAHWFELASAVTSPWLHQDASNYPVIFYRIVSGTYTSHYDVGKYTITLKPGTGTSAANNWISPPLELFSNTVDYVLGNQLNYETDESFDMLQAQMAIGVGPQIDTYYIGGIWTDGGNEVTRFMIGQGYMLVMDATHTAAKTVAFVGKVPDMAVTNMLSAPSGGNPAYNWIGAPSPALRGFLVNGLTNAVVTTETEQNFDVYQNQVTIGGAQKDWYYVGGQWDDGNDGTPLQTPGMGGILILDASHTGANTNWVAPKTR